MNKRFKHILIESVLNEIGVGHVAALMATDAAIRGGSIALARRGVNKSADKETKGMNPKQREEYIRRRKRIVTAGGLLGGPVGAGATYYATKRT